MPGECKSGLTKEPLGLLLMLINPTAPKYTVLKANKQERLNLTIGFAFIVFAGSFKKIVKGFTD